MEHSPTLTSTPLTQQRTIGTPPPPTPNNKMHRADNWLDNWLTTYTDPDNPLNLRFQTFADGTALVSVVENDGLQKREWRFVPEMTGVRIWMTLTTYGPIPAGYIQQQCLRFTGGIGFGFGPTVTKVPFLSELLMQALGNANGTLTWVRLKGSWQALPVTFTRYHTPASFGVYQDSSGQVDCGLVVRENASRAEAPASYWSMVAPDAAWETWSANSCAARYNQSR